MSFSQDDMNCLLAFLERELQSRDARISQLKSERSLEYLYSAKYNQLGFHEAECVDKRSRNEIKNGEYHDDPLIQLDGLVDTQHKAQLRLKEQVEKLFGKCDEICTDAESERTKHSFDLERDTKMQVLLVLEVESLKEELQQMKSTREKLEGDLKRRPHCPGGCGAVVERLLKRRREIGEELRAECQRCLKEEERVEDARRKVVELDGKLKSTREEITKAIQNISGPFCMQVESMSNEFANLRSRISEVESANKECITKIKHNRVAARNTGEDDTTSKPPRSDGFLDASTLDRGVELDVSRGGYLSFLDSFDSTIKLIENTNPPKNLNLDWFNSPQKMKIFAPPPTPNDKPPQRCPQRSVQINASTTNSVNANGRIVRPKSSGVLSTSSGNNSTSPLSPPATSPNDPSRPALHISGTSAAYGSKSTKVATANSPNIHSRFVPPTPPPSLLPSPTNKRPPAKGRPPPPPPPSKPHISPPVETTHHQQAAHYAFKNLVTATAVISHH